MSLINEFIILKKIIRRFSYVQSCVYHRCDPWCGQGLRAETGGGGLEHCGGRQVGGGKPEDPRHDLFGGGGNPRPGRGGASRAVQCARHGGRAGGGTGHAGQVWPH